MRVPVALVDAFTRRAGQGNRAGVVVNPPPLDNAGRLAVARAVAASETAFVEVRDGGASLWLRYFTPTTEVSFCGHATVATFRYLAETGSNTVTELSRCCAAAGRIAGLAMAMMQTSANLSGEPDARRLADVPRELLLGADLVLDGGELPGTASTVVDLRDYGLDRSLARTPRGGDGAAGGRAGARLSARALLAAVHG